MKKFLIFLSTITLILGMVWNVSATTFSGTAFGQWKDVISTESNDKYKVKNKDKGSIATFSWGTPAFHSSQENQFTFDGVGSDGDPKWTTASDTAFLVGDFSYRNGSTYNSAGIDGVTLDLTLSFTDPFVQSDSYNFDFSITNTPNNSGDSVMDGDIVSLSQTLSDFNFTYDGILYTLELLGFSKDDGATIVNNFSSPEGGIASAGVYAQITSNPVPEPGTMLLFGFGVLGLAGISRKSK